MLSNISAIQTVDAHGGAGSPGHERFESITITQHAFAEESKIPDWVKNIFIWYGQGQISEDDVLNAITFLVTNQIIQIDMANQSMGMMGQGMMMQNMPFNVDAPVIMPMIDGYYNRDKVYFVHTEVSDCNDACFPPNYFAENKEAGSHRKKKYYQHL